MIEVGERIQPRVQSGASRLRRLLPLLVAGLDAAMLLAAFVLAYWLRYDLRLGPRIQDRVSFDTYAPAIFLLLGVMMPVLLAKGAYRLRLSREILDEAVLVFSSATSSVAAIVVITFMLHQFVYSRGVIVYVWLLAVVLVTAGRAIFRVVQSLLYRHGWGVRRLLVVGAGDMGKMVMQSVVQRPDLGYELVGFVERPGSGPLRNFGRFRALGTVADLPALIASRQVDEIILALPSSAHEDASSIVRLCESHAVPVKLVPDLLDMTVGRVQVDDIAGIPLLDVQERPLLGLERRLKRCLDVMVAATVLVVSLPLMVALALLIRLESPGSPLLAQERVGLEGRRFRCLKLRTMRPGAEELRPLLEPHNETGGPIFKMRLDPRVTRMGRLMRRFSLDELPQMWNVLRGDMSLVGPRPPLPQEVEQYEPWHHRRLAVKPGLTGIWQVSGRSDLPFDEMVMMDIYYAGHWSLGLDLKVLVRTLAAVLRGRGAY